MYSDGASNAELDDFVERASRINAVVSALANKDGKEGDAALKASDDLIAEIGVRAERTKPLDPAVAAYRAEKAAAETEARLRRGVKGQGARPGYLYFCRACFLEYELEPLAKCPAPAASASSSASSPAAAPKSSSTAHLVCANCAGALITRQQRMDELHSKVALLQERKAERAQRRQAYETWRKEKAAQANPTSIVRSGAAAGADDSTGSSSASTSAPNSTLSSRYASWDFWEPSSDEDESSVPSADNPEFAAMKADIEAREARKKVSNAAAAAANDKGNAAIKARDYLGAVAAYTQAIESAKSEKSYYTNRALARIHSFDYSGALKDCGTALDIFECFEANQNRFRVDYKNMKVVLKAWLRRCRAEINSGGLLAEAKVSLREATKLHAEIYAHSGRAAVAEYVLARKNELQELEKMAREIAEKEAFGKEETQVAAAAAAAAAATGTTADAGNGEAPAASSIAAATSVPADSATITALLASLSSAHAQLLSAAPIGASSGSAAAAAAAPSWSLLTPAVKFLSLALEGEGNKERVATHVESRLCTDVMIKIVKHALASDAAAQTMAAAGAKDAASSSSAALSALPDFASASAIFSASHPGLKSNLILFREREGFAVWARYAHALFAALNGRAEVASTPLPSALLLLAVQVLMALTDREAAREHLASPTLGKLLTELTLKAFTNCAALLPSSSSASSSSSSSQSEVDSLQLSLCHLVANLAFQPKFRSWLCAGAAESASMLEQLFAGVMGLATQCAMTSSSGAGTKPSEKGARVLSAGLTMVINLLTFAGCRARFMEAGGGGSKASSPLSLLLSSLSSLTACWAAAGYRVQARSSLADLSDKMLSIVLNLSVDDSANVAIFAAMLALPAAKDGSGMIARLLTLASKPAADSKDDEPASASSIRSDLPPVLVARALGVVTRGLRCEHNAASASKRAGDAAAAAAAGAGSAPAAASPRPIRALVQQAQGAPIMLRILTLHACATADEAASTESVLAKLESNDEAASAASAAAAAPASVIAASAAASFRYNRLTMEHASVCLAILLSQDAATARSVAISRFQGSSALSVLVSLLSSPSRNIVGNACLCLDGLTGVPELLVRPELSAALPVLVSILKDPTASSAHQNAAKAAIVIGRSPNNVDAWTAMRGLEVIARVMAPSLLKK